MRLAGPRAGEAHQADHGKHLGARNEYFTSSYSCNGLGPMPGKRCCVLAPVEVQAAPASRHNFQVAMANTGATEVALNESDGVIGIARPFLQWHRETIYNSA